MNLNWLHFWTAILPELIAFARVLFTRHNGDAKSAKAEMRAITNHGLQLDEFEIELRRRMDKLKEREAQG